MNTGTAYYMYGTFLVCCGRYDRAEDFFLRALEKDPENLVAVLSYGLFLYKYLDKR